MTVVIMIEAALFQLRAEAEKVDSSLAPQLGLCVSVLAKAVEAARDEVNAARVSDIEFALNDLGSAIDELPQSEADRLLPLLAAIRGDLESLKTATSLDPALLEQIHAFEWKLRDRMKAIERQTYVESGESTPLPHPPRVLRHDAIELSHQLAAAGFATPSLDALIADPDSLRFHSIREILDELEVIAG
jgi:hypothetical protein